MKKLSCVLISLVCAFSLYVSVLAEEVLHYNFEDAEGLTAVTNTLGEGGSAVVKDSALVLDGTYGLKLGEVGTTFTVSAIVEITSNGGTNTIFFKDMDGVGNKWTGVLSKYQKPSLWTHGDSFAWTTIADGNSDLSSLSYVTYVENSGVGSLYVNGELMGTGNVATGEGILYLGVTYWQADAVSGLVDEVKLYNRALTEEEIKAEFEESIDFENAIQLPVEVIDDITLPVSIASKTITWTTSDSSVIDADGTVNRHDTDKKVTLTASIDGNILKIFEITVLKNPVIVNNDVLLSYKFGSNDGKIIHDVSGNGNHGASYNNLSVGSDGAEFDGVDDYVKMPEGVLYGYDDITIVMTLKPDGAQKHVFAYGFGNTADTGYMFFNPSRPDTNSIRFAATKTDWREEKEIVSIPGIRSGEWATVVMTISENGYIQMYVDGDLVMDGNLNMSVSELGKTTANYIAKSLYDGDPYFKGMVKEFTVYSYCMRESKIKELYGRDVEYAPSFVINEYITSVSFEKGIDVEVDNNGRDDVKIGVAVLDETYDVIQVKIASSSDELSVEEEGTICVFAFDEEHNIPGNLYVKGDGEGFSFEYTPGKVAVVCEENHTNGTVVIAGYDIAGTLTGVAMERTDLEVGVPKEIMGDFDNAVRFKMMYWDNLESMTTVE